MVCFLGAPRIGTRIHLVPGLCPWVAILRPTHHVVLPPPFNRSLPSVFIFTCGISRISAWLTSKRLLEDLPIMPSIDEQKAAVTNRSLRTIRTVSHYQASTAAPSLLLFSSLEADLSISRNSNFLPTLASSLQPNLRLCSHNSQTRRSFMLLYPAQLP